MDYSNNYWKKKCRESVFLVRRWILLECAEFDDPIIHASAGLEEAVGFEIWDSEGGKTYGMRM